MFFFLQLKSSRIAVTAADEHLQNGLRKPPHAYRTSVTVFNGTGGHTKQYNATQEATCAAVTRRINTMNNSLWLGTSISFSCNNAMFYSSDAMNWDDSQCVFVEKKISAF